MKYVYTDRKVTLSNNLHDYAGKRLEKLDRFFKQNAEANFTFTVEKDNRCVVELTVRSGGTFFRAEESSTGDMEAAVDAAVDAIERQIRKNKTRLEKRLRQGAFEREIPVAEAQVEEEDFDLVRKKKFPIKPMTVEEAILQMNLLGHNFFAFRNEDDGGAFAVVYTRNNGGYGLIENDEE